MENKRRFIALVILAGLVLGALVIDIRSRTPKSVSTTPIPTVYIEKVVETTPAPTKKATPTPTPEPTKEPANGFEWVPKEDLVIYESDEFVLKVEKIYRDIADCDRLVVYATNKSDKEIGFYFDDVTINDEMTNIAAGESVLPGKSGRFFCYINLYPLSIDSMDQVEKIELDVQLEINWKKYGEPQKAIIEF